MGSLRNTTRKIAHDAVAVDDSITAIVLNSAARQNLIIKSMAGSDTVYLGGSSVTTTDGYPLAAGEWVEFEGHTGAIYAVCAATKTADLRYIEFLE